MLDWLFSDEDLEIATKAFSSIVGHNPTYALSFAPVCQWSEEDWALHASTLASCGFDRFQPGHLTAFQWLFDQACDRTTNLRLHDGMGLAR